MRSTRCILTALVRAIFTCGAIISLADCELVRPSEHELIQVGMREVWPKQPAGKVVRVISGARGAIRSRCDRPEPNSWRATRWKTRPSGQRTRICWHGRRRAIRLTIVKAPLTTLSCSLGRGRPVARSGRSHHGGGGPFLRYFVASKRPSFRECGIAKANSLVVATGGFESLTYSLVALR